MLTAKDYAKWRKEDFDGWLDHVYSRIDSEESDPAEREELKSLARKRMYRMVDLATAERDRIRRRDEWLRVPVAFGILVLLGFVLSISLNGCGSHGHRQYSAYVDDSDY